MTDNDSALVRDSLLYLIKGLKEWSKDWKTISEELHKGHLLFIQLALKEGNLPPGNLHDLLMHLQKPCRDWGISAYQDLFEVDRPLFSEYRGLTEEAEDFLEEYISVEESEQRVMRQILIYCREKLSHGTEQEKSQYDHWYRTIREFISMPKHALLTAGEVYDFAFSLGEPQLSNLFLALYEEVPRPYDQYAYCPYCGWTLAMVHGSHKCTSRTCHLKGEFGDLKSLKGQTSENLMRLTRGIQRYVLVPGITEHSLYRRIKEDGHDVQLYPEVDEYDLRVFTAFGDIDLDVKEYYSPNRLAEYLNQKGEKFQSKQCYLVIPTHVLKEVPAFIERVRSRLTSDVCKLQIIRENQVLRLCKEGDLA